MNTSIEKPKVFISYSWAGEEYEQQIYKLCKALKENGIEVIYDKWSLKPGNDLNYFMENIITDKELTNVLILLDPSYAKKANNRSGGVGKETQIISEEVYNKVGQTKFIPVIMKKNSDGKIDKPVYLNSILHIDLSNEDEYDDNLKDLIRILFGRDLYEEPPLGTPPVWLDEKNEVIKSKEKYSDLKKKISNSLKDYLIQDYINEIVDDVSKFNDGEAINHFNSSICGKHYLDTVPIRDNFLKLLKMSIYVEDGHKYMVEAIEKIYNTHNMDFRKDIFHLLCYELLIYLTAFYLKYNRFSEVSYLLHHKYFLNYNYSQKNIPSSFIGLREYSDYFDDYIKQRDNKNYYSGTAHYFYTSTNTLICDTDTFIYADEFLFNASIFMGKIDQWSFWFPIMYCYDRYGTNIKRLAMKLKTKEYLDKFALCLGFTSTNDFKNKYEEIKQQSSNGLFKEIKYDNSFDRAITVFDFTKSAELGIF